VGRLWAVNKPNEEAKGKLRAKTRFNGFQSEISKTSGFGEYILMASFRAPHVLKDEIIAALKNPLLQHVTLWKIAEDKQLNLHRVPVV
jgi:hypothetical protein